MTKIIICIRVIRITKRILIAKIIIIREVIKAKVEWNEEVIKTKEKLVSIKILEEEAVEEVVDVVEEIRNKEEEDKIVEEVVKGVSTTKISKRILIHT